ncbi:DEAD/DEAH box helicase [Anaerobacillus alkaliphilus]|uniref:DEAD/DEAH box helicase n=1 Tax=Anaerobacillus alkaliphilus TaxID=1548597 RepID=A0A4Q0VQB2_9BACI|nr:DEAD/DEAH box helicase [Anaerobacillus alkaliphilus]RXI98702.1 DEAD/DEAH box helicase [Anaerobacillus alkaliphilus]
MKKLSLQQFIEELRDDENVVHWHEIEGQEAKTVPFPSTIDRRIIEALISRGVNELYTHQGSAFELALAGKSFTAITPTASGKTLCYNLPVLQQICEDPSSRALYIFPTKALAQDQRSELNEVIDAIGADIKGFTYDGDTAPNIRQVVRKAGHIVITNPDMLHSAILPHHTKWVSLFENLKYVVIDELHTYRGVFGSHVANVVRRLKRICAYYGSDPVFICTSATIANPEELSETLTGKKMTVINNNGAPRGKKHFVFYNPPIINKPLQIRKSTTVEVKRLASKLLSNQIKTIVFARSRVRVEIILSHLQELVAKQLGKKSIRGYRGGYLPKQRREIEQGLRSGDIKGVVSTNALELGVDIGQLQACVMTGYPGSIASVWQQAGRAGRRHDEALIIMVANSTPIDQFLVQQPEYFFEATPEHARINPDNLIILVDHLKCAAYELPFKQGDLFDGVDVEDVLHFLTEEQVLHHQQNKWFWMNESFPAHNISLRSAAQENVVIIDQTDVANHQVIGEMDTFSAMTLLHDEALYLHEGTQYQVEKLDWEEKKAFVREVDVDYFTDANLAVQLKVLEVDKQKTHANCSIEFGDVTVNAMATIFKKIKLSTFETIGSGPIHLPEQELHTNATWIQFEESVQEEIGKEAMENALLGLSHVLQAVSSVYVMCDRNDLRVVPQMKAVHSGKPTIFLYDRYPGGVGLSEDVYKHIKVILERTKHYIRACTCEEGCPSCVGVGSKENTKELSLTLLARLLEARDADVIKK